MKVNVQAVNFNVDKKLLDFSDERLGKLEKFYDKIVSSEVFLKLENTTEKENKTAEVKIHVPGDEFIVKKTAKSFEEALDSCAESLERVLIKHKEKSKSYL